jgi:5'-3' exonuclease
LATLDAAREEALLYKRLATLRTDVPLADSLEDIAYHGAPREALTAFCREIGAERTLERVSRWALP